jgi:prolyl oligopeptidase
LFKVAIPKVGVFDMAIFKKYTAGKYWLEEYGNIENEKDYNYLLDYSPYHNIKKEVNYPTTLIITSENDDRVPPLHSYKFAAELQNRTAQKNPIYLKTTKKAGHYGDSSTYEKQLNEKAEFYSFLMYQLNQ